MNKHTKRSDTKNPFHPDNLRLDTDEVRTMTPKKLKEWGERYALFPMAWVERLKGASGQTWMVAVQVLYRDFWDNTRKGKASGQPFKFANGMLTIYGVPPQSKRRALRDLERRGLVAVEWRPKKSPMVRLLRVAGAMQKRCTVDGHVP
jgi:hypothetical protein